MIRVTTILAAIIAGLAGPAYADTSAPASESNDVTVTDGNITSEYFGFCGCDLFQEGKIDLLDFALLALDWRDTDCSHFNDWCNNSDFNHDTYVNLKDLLVIVDCWLDEDLIPPEPDAMQWDPDIDESGFDGRPRQVYLGPDETWDWGATMRADPNTLDDTGFEFYFECTNSGYRKVWPEGYSSGWLSFPEGPPYYWTVDVGQKNQSFSFRVRARDLSINSNMTAWSPTVVMRL